MGTVRVEQALQMSTEGRGAALLALPEDQWFDRKSSRIEGKDLAKHLLGLANAEGGTLVIGLHDGKVEGVDSVPARQNDWRQAAIDFCHPPVQFRFRLVECVNEAEQPDHLAVIDINVSEKVHVSRSDEVFLRVGDETRKLTFAQRNELTYDKDRSAFESTVVPNFTIRDVDAELLAGYARAVRHPDEQRLLIARGLMTPSGALTVGGTLLFAEHPQSAFPEAHVRVLRQMGTERQTGYRQQLIDDVRCEGPIPHVLNRAQEVAQDLLPKRRALGSSGRFEEMEIVPRDAWLEGLVNAVIHRSYSMAGDHIRFEIFDDRVEIESPGRFPGLVNPNDTHSVNRFARNPRIARVCADLNFGQELGEGIRRIHSEMRLAGLASPTYFQSSGSVRLTLSYEAIDQHLEFRLPTDSQTVLRSIRRAGRMSTGEIADVLGKGRPATLRRLNALKREGLIEWVGQSPSDPHAFWRIKSR